MPELVYGNGFEVLRIEPTHLVEVSRLAFHHKDPFDRLLIAQSLVEEMPIISVDATLDDYDIERLW